MREAGPWTAEILGRRHHSNFSILDALFDLVGGGGGKEVESLSGAFLRLRVAMLDGGSVNGSQTGDPVSEVFGATESG